MTQEEINLVLQDICSRLLYTLYIRDEYGDIIKIDKDTVKIDTYFNSILQGNIKPYLRPLSDMSKEEKNELIQIRPYMVFEDGTVKSAACNTFYQMAEVLDWLNVHHFDYRRLIEMNLAYKATKDMYKDEL